MHDMTKTRMLLTTAVLAAVAALLAAPANAKYLDYQDGGPSATTAAVQIGPGVIPYMSHGIGVDESRFQGGEPSLGLTGDSPRTRVAAPEPEGLTGDSALTRYPARGSGPTVSASSSDDTDWTAFGLGAALAALVAAGLAGVLLTARHRGRVALP